VQNIKKSIASAGVNEDHLQWHISKHDVYGTRFLRAWENTGEEMGMVMIMTPFRF
jgi:hypothetical protein